MLSMCKWCALFIILFCFISFAVDSSARDFKTPQQALKDAFPGASIEVKNIVLSKLQVENIERLSGVKLNTRLVSWYIAKRGNSIVGYAYIDTHTVRTHPEVVLYTITPEGKIDLVEVLSFNEPLEYMPDENWLKLFKGKMLTADALRLRRDIPNMTGATLTSRAITDNTRKVLAMWQVIFGGER
jgi:electron transport complex protein RnfG